MYQRNLKQAFDCPRHEEDHTDLTTTDRIRLSKPAFFRPRSSALCRNYTILTSNRYRTRISYCPSNFHSLDPTLYTIKKTISKMQNQSTTAHPHKTQNAIPAANKNQK